MKNLKFLFASCILMAQPAFANESITSNIKYALKQTTQSNYFSVAVALGVVILLIYITAIVYAKLNIFGQSTMKKQYLGLNDSKVMILSSTPIGNNKSLLVVELAGKKMLIGVTNENINLIKDLGDIDESEIELDSLKLQASDSEVKVKKEDKEVKENKESKENIQKEEKVKPKDDSDEFGLYKKYLDK